MTEKPKRKPISDLALAYSAAPPKPTQHVDVFKLPEFPPGVAPTRTMAMDDATSLSASMLWAQNFLNAATVEGQAFLGYAALSEMAQRPEYRRIVEIRALEMTRKWIRLTAKGDHDKTEKIALLNEAMIKFDVRELFYKLIETDGFFGRAHLYIDTGDTENPEELKQPLGDGRSFVSREKVTRGGVKGFRIVEPMWVYPLEYNTTNPLAADWYRPERWFAMRAEVHRERLLTYVGREVPDILKAPYAFGGLSATQMAKPYVDNWIRTRQSVSDLIHSFTVRGVKVALQEALELGEEQLYKRLALFANIADNRGIMALDNGTGNNGVSEDFFNISTPLSTLDHLQAQAQEQMASIAAIPLVKLLGVTPSGLNASSDGEIRVFYDEIAATQEKKLRPMLETVISFIQLSEFGDVDPEITFEFEPLWELGEDELASARKTEAETGEILIRAGVISRAEERTRIASDEESAYAALDLATPPALAADVRADVGVKISAAVIEAFNAGLIDQAKSLTELKNAAPETGLFTTISNEDIVEAELAPPPVPDVSEFGAPTDQEASGLVPKPDEPLLKGAPKPMNAVKREVEAQ